MDEQTVYPRFLRRVQAGLVDSFIFFIVILTWWMILPFLEHYPVWIKLAYPAIIWLLLDPILVSLTGGTPGHHLRKISILSVKEGRLGILRSVLRSLLKAATGCGGHLSLC
jgi:type III secretory pathway component EscT